MKAKGKVIYYVEGETEEKLVTVLKKKHIVPGKIKKHNIASKIINNLQLRTLEKDTTIVGIFDVDIFNASILLRNVNTLNENKFVKELILVIQIDNFEDEIIYSTNINKITQFFDSNSKTDFKKEFIKANNILSKLEEKQFDINKLWSRNKVDFPHITNSIKIKIN